MRSVPSSARSVVAAGRPVLNAVIGAILTGGASRRFHGDKAAVIGPLVLRAMREAGVDPVVSIGGRPGVLPVPSVADRYPGEGPLGAVATAASYARSGWLLTATCDLPRLDAGTISLLLDAIDPEAAGTAVVASVDAVPQVSLAAWPASWARSIHRSVRAGERRFQHLLGLGPVRLVDVPADAVTDADDRETLADIMAAESSEDMPGQATPQA